MLVCVQVINTGIAVASVPDQIGTIDFVNGVYEFEGVSYTAAQVVSNPGFITANGYESPQATDGDPPFELLSPFADYLLAGEFTVVVEVTIFGPPQHDNIQILRIGNIATSPNIFLGLGFVGVLGVSSEGQAFSDTNDPIGTGDFVEAGVLSAGLHTLAWTLRSNRISLSADHDPVEAVNYTAGNFSCVGGKVSIGGMWGNAETTKDAFYLRKMKIWATPQDDADLPGLTP